MKTFVLICLGISALSSVTSYKVLTIFHLPVKSHFHLASAYAKGLANAGHDVTLISPFEDKTEVKNGSYRNIVLTGAAEVFQNATRGGNVLNGSKIPNVMVQFMGLYYGPYFTEYALAHENMQKLLNSGEAFDVVVIVKAMNEALNAIAAHFNAPLITFSTFGSGIWINPTVGNPSSASVPELLLGLHGDMSFLERLWNTLYRILYHSVYKTLILPKHDQLAHKYIPSENLGYLGDILDNTSLVLINSDPSLGQPVPKVPCMIDIGGFHVPPPKKLPKDLQEFLDSAEHGAILFSLGSIVKSTNLPDEKRNTLINAFGKLKLKVLWKFEGDNLETPKNVKLGKWLPQSDILSHKNLRLFITHGGLLSTTEAVYRGIPIILIPFFADQYVNAKNAQENGIGRILNFNNITEDSVLSLINEVLNNPSYKKNVQKRSNQLKDKPMTALETAIFWTEYVVRHKGADHLKVGALKLNWFQNASLDVYLAIFLSCVGWIYCVFLLIRKIVRRRQQKTKTE